MKSTLLKLTILILFNLLIVSFTNAQVNAAPPTINKQEKAAQIVSELDLAVHLDEKQKEEITKLYINFLENLEKARKDFDKKPHKTQMKMLEKIKLLNQEKENKLVSLLGPDQLGKYYKLQEEAKKVKKTPLNQTTTPRDTSSLKTKQ